MAPCIVSTAGKINMHRLNITLEHISVSRSRLMQLDLKFMA